MNIKKYSRLLAFILLLIMFMPYTLVNAASVGWPVDVSADDSSVTVEDESVPVDAIEDSVSVTEDGSLSAIDDTTDSLDDSAIFPEEEYGLVNRLTSNGTTTNKELSEAEQIYSNYSDVVPVVTTDQMVEWILKKGNEIISILQIFAQPFAIIIFIVSCAICLIGTLTKGNMAGKGLIGMVASAILYAACLYAPLLVNSISGFMAS